jgi:S1-C subfamily serine protease
MGRTAILLILFPLALLSGATRIELPQVAASPSRASERPAPPPTLAPLLAATSPAVVNVSVQGTVQVRQSPLFQDPLFLFANFSIFRIGKTSRPRNFTLWVRV